MKRCPQCNRTYSDDSLKYCLSDGTQLIPVVDSVEKITVISPSPFIQQSSQSRRQGVNPMFTYLTIGVLALIVGGAVVMLMKSDSNINSTVEDNVPNTSSNSFDSKPDKEREQLNGQRTSLQEEQASLEKEKLKLLDERRKLEARKNEFVEAATPASSAQPTERIKFHRGSVQETISGNIIAERNFVLRARKGQHLSAAVNSGNGCVIFADGSTSTNYTTTSGDNYIRLKNNCDGTNFSLTIYIR